MLSLLIALNVQQFEPDWQMTPNVESLIAVPLLGLCLVERELINQAHELVRGGT